MYFFFSSFVQVSYFHSNNVKMNISESINRLSTFTFVCMNNIIFERLACFGTYCILTEWTKVNRHTRIGDALNLIYSAPVVFSLVYCLTNKYIVVIITYLLSRIIRYNKNNIRCNSFFVPVVISRHRSIFFSFF